MVFVFLNLNGRAPVSQIKYGLNFCNWELKSVMLKLVYMYQLLLIVLSCPGITREPAQPDAPKEDE